jgi:hypothetical protein
MTEVNLKCQRCGFPAVLKVGPVSNFEFSYPKEIYTICPVVTERLDNGEAGVRPLDCQRRLFLGPPHNDTVPFDPRRCAHKAAVDFLAFLDEDVTRLHAHGPQPLRCVRRRMFDHRRCADGEDDRPGGRRLRGVSLARAVVKEARRCSVIAEPQCFTKTATRAPTAAAAPLYQACLRSTAVTRLSTLSSRALRAASISTMPSILPSTRPTARCNSFVM